MSRLVDACCCPGNGLQDSEYAGEPLETGRITGESQGHCKDPGDRQ